MDRPRQISCFRLWGEAASEACLLVVQRRDTLQVCFRLDERSIHCSAEANLGNAIGEIDHSTIENETRIKRELHDSGKLKAIDSQSLNRLPIEDLPYRGGRSGGIISEDMRPIDTEA